MCIRSAAAQRIHTIGLIIGFEKLVISLLTGLQTCARLA